MSDTAYLDPADKGTKKSGGAIGSPLLLPTDLIDEDPTQPRTEFDANSLQELAETIRARGVRQPISVRTHPDRPDRWMLNFGARRLRASRIAGLDAVPAFVDETANAYDQVIENEQREQLTPLEIALFIQRQRQIGESHSEIASKLGKSRSYITFASALIDAPDWLIGLYREGRCRGVTELYELRRLHETYGDAVALWSAEQGAIGRTDIAALKARLVLQNNRLAISTKSAPSPNPPSGTQDASVGEAITNKQRMDAARKSPLGRSKVAGAVLVAEHCQHVVEVLLDAIPSEEGEVYVRTLSGGERRLVPAHELKILRVAIPLDRPLFSS